MEERRINMMLVRLLWAAHTFLFLFLMLISPNQVEGYFLTFFSLSLTLLVCLFFDQSIPKLLSKVLVLLFFSFYLILAIFYFFSDHPGSVKYLMFLLPLLLITIYTTGCIFKKLGK